MASRADTMSAGSSSSEASPGDSGETWIKVQKIEKLKQPVGKAQKITIFKVPKPIRDVNPEAYDPVVACVGPFHHCPDCWSYVMQKDPKMETKSQLDGEAYKAAAASCRQFDSTSTMQKYKWRCVWRLLSHPRTYEERVNESPEKKRTTKLHLGNVQERANQRLEECLEKLKEMNDEVRRCYSEELPPWIDDRKLASIMLLDGCFIINLMIIWKERKDELGKKGIQCTFETQEGNVALDITEDLQLKLPTGEGRFTSAFVPVDLLKLENQIPFSILRFLFRQLKLRCYVNYDLVKLALNLFKDIFPKEPKSFRDKEEPLILRRKYDHLLHLFHSFHIPPSRQSEYALCDVDTRKPKWIPGATDLDRAGLKIIRGNRSDSFLNITFNLTEKKFMPKKFMPSQCGLLFMSGRMEIPPLQISDHSVPLFLNLIALEQDYDVAYITTYVNFMNCITYQAEDVRLLRLEGILEHGFANDQAVVDFFNQFSNQIRYARAHDYIRTRNYLGNRINEINRFYDFQNDKSLVKDNFAEFFL